MDRLGPFLHEGYKIWDWRHNVAGGRLLHYTADGMDVYRRPNGATTTRTASRWVRTEAAVQREYCGSICTVREARHGRPTLLATAPASRPRPRPGTILELLEDWGNTWLWSTLRLIDKDNWPVDAIADGTCLAVADGSFIREEYTDVCSAAFVIKCTAGRGRIIGSFPEQSTAACSYRGELLGLMAIHLLLLAANRLSPSLSGSVTIHSDCFGALEKVATLPENRIPTRCWHSDTLKNIMVTCGELTFQRTYQHVRAHQDDHADYATLSRPSQLNCIVDLHAKLEIWGLEGAPPPAQEPFLLEPVSVFVGKEKMTLDTGASLRYWVHLQLARDTFFQLGVMSTHSFDEVAWRQVYDTLHEVPCLFQLWACKQVMEVAGTNLQQSHYTEGHDPHYPSCAHALETCSHVLHCEEAGCVDALAGAISRLDTWLHREHTDPTLRRCLVDYARGRGSLTMEEITRCHGDAYRRLGRSQDKIGWRRFMEGMISREVVALQDASVDNVGGAASTAKWA